MKSVGGWIQSWGPNEAWGFLGNRQECSGRSCLSDPFCHWGCGHLNILEETLILYLGFLSQQVMSLTISPTLELLTLHNTGGSRQNVSNQETHFPVREIRQLASHGPWSYFPSTRSSWSYRTMKWCSENRSSSTQETAPVRLGHFLVENDMWEKKKMICDLTQWLKCSVNSPSADIRGSETKGWGWGWKVAALTITLISKNISFPSPKSLTFCGLNCPSGRGIFAREPDEGSTWPSGTPPTAG